MRRMLMMCLALFLSANAAYAEIIQEEVTYSGKDGIDLKGFIAYDNATKDKRPGVLVVHEWWGHNQYARDRAKMLAELGYVAMALDMYGEGKQAHHPEEAQKFSSAIAQNMDLAKARFQAALDVLKANPHTDAARIAAIGYCFGGAVVLQMAREGVDLAAAVSFHGSLGTAHPAKAGAVKAKILVAHGAADPFIKPEDITGFMKEMNAASANYTFIAYSGAVHAFTNPQADEYGKQFNLPLKYNAEADRASWRDMQTLFNDVFK